MSDTITQRIQRLLALAQSPNQHEAELALAEAQRLMLKHGIEAAALSSAPPPVEDRQVRGVWAGQDWYRGLVDAVARACFCEAVYYPAVRADPERGVVAREPWIQVIGRGPDVASACLLAEWIRSQVNRLADLEWAVAKMARGANRVRWQNSFRLGCSQRVAQRLRETRPASAAAAAAEAGRAGGDGLVLLRRYEGEAREAIALWKHRAGLVTRSARGSRPADADGFVEGVAAGDRVQLEAPRNALPARRT